MESLYAIPTPVGIDQGGTGQTTKTPAFDSLSPAASLGDTIYHDGSDNVRLAGNTTSTRKFLRQTGNGSASAAPAWDTLVSGDLPSTGDINARVAVKKTGSVVGTRRGINFLDGTGISITVTDDSGNEEVDVSIASTASAAVFTESGGVIRPTTPANLLRLGTWTGTPNAIFTPVAGSAPLQLLGETDAGGGLGFQVWNAHNTTSVETYYAGYRTGGTVASPTKTTNNMRMLRLAAIGYTGSALAISSVIDFDSRGDWDTTPENDIMVKFGASPVEVVRFSSTGFGGNSGGIRIRNLSAYGTLLANGTTYCDVATVDGSNHQYIGGSTAADLTIYNDTIILGVTSSASVRAAGDFTLTRTFAIKTTKNGGGTCEMLSMEDDNVVYVFGSPAAGGHLYNNTITAGVNSSAVMTCLGLLVVNNDIRLPNGGAYKAFKADGSTLCEMLSIESDNIVYVIGSPAAGGHLYNNTITAHVTNAGIFTILGGLVMGAPTGGNKGAGTINVAADIYKNNTAYTNPDYAFEHWATGKVERFIDNPGAAGYQGRMSLKDLEAHCREHLRLPGISSEAMGIFTRGDFLLEKVEEIFTYLFDFRKQLEALAA